MKLEKHISEQKTETSLGNLKNEINDYLNNGDLARLLLTAMGEKPATDVEVFLPDEEELNKLISKLNSIGYNCYVNRNPGKTIAESFTKMLGDTSNTSEMIEKAEIKARIFCTKKQYSKEFFKPITDKKYKTKMHRRYGEFLQFEEENIESFIYSDLPIWKKVFYRLRKSKPETPIGPLKALDKYEDNPSQEKQKLVSALTFGKVADTQKNYRKMLEKTRKRKNAVKKSELELNFFLENLADPRIEMEDQKI
ncbi:hypothetical protein [Candidatus Nanohalobium constans]|nr:hypothetical protein [Candidatus Nanohalobium constans]